ncbi:MAG: 3-methyl-2-oxobutanoate dehydrogenase subunit VorB [Mycoplasmataceae bacterium]|nr:3-methyl-2-oxobutanoate dehydrogenase subunit VorB [Mycoplasmataceae bacterium]
MAKQLLKGNEAIAYAAILGGADVFFGYPITPQNEIPEYLSAEMFKHNKLFVQGESEVASINMIYGAAGAGARAMTSSSSPGIALMQEGISYLCGAELPCVIISVMRGGPGLGGIQPSQADYNQATRGGGNGDYHCLVYAPANIQEAINITKESFEIAECYRNPVIILIDGLIGQMMEAVDFDHVNKKRTLPDKKDYCTLGTKNHDHKNIVNSLYLDPYDLEKHNIKLHQKYQKIIKEEVMVEVSSNIEQAEVVVVAYGTMARIAQTAINELNQNGYKVGMIRPITLWPYPYDAFKQLKNCKHILITEMSMGQMVQDVLIATRGSNIPVDFFGRCGGVIPEPDEVANAIKQLVAKGGK